jgi:nicotinamidase-related amidase
MIGYNELFYLGEEVVPVINQVIRDVNFDVVAYTYDWHPLNHISFYENRHLRKASPESPVCKKTTILEQRKGIFYYLD